MQKLVVYATFGALLLGSSCLALPRPPIKRQFRDVLSARPKAGPGAKEPLDDLPTTNTRGKSINKYFGIADSVLSLANTSIAYGYKRAAEKAGISDENGKDVAVGANAVRFYAADPLIIVNFDIDEHDFYQFKSSFQTTAHIGLTIDNMIQGIVRNDVDFYAKWLDYIGELHHTFANDLPANKKNIDLGLFMKDSEAHVRGMATFFTGSEWTLDIQQAMYMVFQYVRWNTWHISSSFGFDKNCFRRGDELDSSRVLN